MIYFVVIKNTFQRIFSNKEKSLTMIFRCYINMHQMNKWNSKFNIVHIMRINIFQIRYHKGILFFSSLKVNIFCSRTYTLYKSLMAHWILTTQLILMKGNIHMSTTQSRNTVIAVAPDASYMPHHIIALKPKCSHCILDIITYF